MSSKDISRPHAHGPEVPYPPLNGCTGPGEILDRFVQMQPRGTYVPRAADYWNQLRLRRGGVGFGSLWDVRQSLHRWVVEMEVWKQDGRRRG